MIKPEHQRIVLVQPLPDLLGQCLHHDMAATVLTRSAAVYTHVVLQAAMPFLPSLEAVQVAAAPAAGSGM